MSRQDYHDRIIPRWNGKPWAVVDNLTRLAPLERLGRPEDIANAVAFLTGPDGGWINV
ncbi:hypothetical protein [Acidiphilium multivorum]|uniref:hypothetical protein n=1 Tax=Acidiphilium multivorum TaxID=62140 RepID=UPI001B8CA53F